ncbi:MAG: glutaredoxin family protein [Pseudomonadota bacterium]
MKATLNKLLTTGTVALAAAMLMVPAAQAQQVYRIVGPDGKVTFSDKPPPVAAPAKVTAGSGAAAGSSGGPGGSGGSGLPFELRQVASKFPVTLYTSSVCAPCGSARNMLNARGIPFTEKTVNTAADSQALLRISGDNSLPFLTIGGQQLKGYSDGEWTQFLNAAGYPATSQLPASYRQASASPIVAAAPPAPSAPAASQEVERPAPPPIQAAPSNPAGIKF